MTFRAIRNIKPTAPISLTATADSGYTRMKLAWTDTSNNRDGFEIHRSGDGSTGWAFVATVRRTNWGDGVNYYTDTGLTRGNTYYYKIRGFNGAGFGRWSNVANDTIWQLSDVTLYAEYDANADVYEDSGGVDPCEDGDGVWVMKDQANSYDLVQATVGARPSYQTSELNGLPVIRHAIGDLLVASTASDWKFLHDGTEFAVYVVWKATDVDSDTLQVFFDTGGLSSVDTGFVITYDDRSSQTREDWMVVNIAKGDSGNFEGEPRTLDEGAAGGEWHITAVRQTATDLEVLTDGHYGGDATNALDGSPSASNPTSALTIGARYTNTWNLLGDWARILIISGTVSDANHEAVQDFLAEEYALADIVFFDTASNVTNDNTHNAFGSIVLADNGDLVVAYRKSVTGHEGGDGETVVRISTDEGATWGSENIVLTSASYDYRWAGLSKLANGTLMMTVARADNPTAVIIDGARLITSNDNGKTWSTDINIAHSYTGWNQSSGHIIELANGDLLTAMTGSDSGDAAAERRIRISRSQDKGITWAHLSNVAGPINYITEPGLVQLDNGDVVCLIRLGISDNIQKAVSDDNGATWGARTTILSFAFGMQNPILLDNGVIAEIARMDTALSAVLVTSLDSGDSWQIGYRFPDSPEGAHMTYGGLDQDPDGTIYGFYSNEDSIGGADSATMFVKTS